MISLILPYPPSNNRYYRHAKGRNFIGEEGKAYRLEVLAVRPRSGWPLRGNLKLEIDVFPQRERSLDLDNVPKSVQDSLQSAFFFKNDFQIVDLHVRRMPKVEKAYLAVRISELAGL